MKDLFEYNTWANDQVLAGTDALSEAQLGAPMPELGGSVLELLDHYEQVEAAFLAAMTGGPLRESRDARAYGTVREALRATAAAWAEAVPRLEQRLGETFPVPWWRRSFTVEQGLLQVVTHSVQHRAGVCAGIARAGGKPPELDYIIWLAAFR